MRYNVVLTDLPTTPRVDGEDISLLYTSELRSVETEEQLEAFTEKWTAIWLLSCSDPSDAEQSIVYNTYDKTQALKCIAECREGACSHVKSGASCAGAHIVMPYIMMQCFFIAHEYGAPFNVALVQLQKALGNLPDNVANMVF